MSQHLVNWIQIGGLIAGLYGFFFLSISIFGENSTPWFRALLPATAVGMGFIIAVTAQRFRNGDLAIFICITLFQSAYAYLMSVSASSRSKDIERKLLRRQIIGVVILYLSVAIGFAAVSKIENMSVSTFLQAEVGAAVGNAGLALAYTAQYILSSKRLQALGFVLSLFAILTQFVQPVLVELFHVTVK